MKQLIILIIQKDSGTSKYLYEEEYLAKIDLKIKTKIEGFGWIESVNNNTCVNDLSVMQLSTILDYLKSR